MDDLDCLLDSALDDFQKVGISQNSVKKSASHSKVSGTEEKLANSWNDSPAQYASGGISRPTVGQGLGLGLPELVGGKKKSTGAKASFASSSSTSSRAGAAGEGGSGNAGDLAPERPLSETLEKLAQQTRETVGNIECINDDNLLGDDLVEKLMKQFEEIGGSQDMQTIMDTMMRQLLSKEVLHEPLKEIGERYPTWLAANKSLLSEEDFSRYSRQHHFILELCEVYELTPDDFPKIMELMQSMQNCGQPPSDIVKELAPGLDVDEDGMPMLPDFASMGAGGQPSCSIM